jgi:hypothetical protein
LGWEVYVLKSREANLKGACEFGGIAIPTGWGTQQKVPNWKNPI